MPKYSVSKKREDTYHYQSIFDITNPATNILKKKKLSIIFKYIKNLSN